MSSSVAHAESKFRPAGQAALGAPRIGFLVGECSLGTLLVAATAQGVCAIALGDDEATLRTDLERRFPQVRSFGLDPSLAPLFAQVTALVEQPRTALKWPLDVQGTTFQARVWQALAAIPAGTTVSYAELAEALGSPAAVRAVAGACAANPLAVVIPCHRVVRKDGALAGYRWGLARKVALLEREKRDAATRVLQ